MSIDNEDLLKGLLQYNYLPRQKKDKEELPPVFSSESLTPKASQGILQQGIRKTGYDQITYDLTRYNQVSRPLSIPHPKPYTELCHVLTDNWEKLNYITKNDHSLNNTEEAQRRKSCNYETIWWS